MRTRTKRKYNRQKAFNIINKSSGDLEALSEKSFNSETDEHGKKYVDIQIKTISFICRNCDSKFTTEDDLLKHINEEKDLAGSSNEEYKCKICNKIFKNNKILRTHIKNLHTKPRKKFECCGLIFIKEEKYIFHTNKFHNDELERYPNGEFLCKYCNKTFRSYQTVLDHINNIHTKGQAYLCNICGKKYYSLVILRHHTKKHDESEDVKVKVVFECPHCGKECRTIESLEAHKLTAHTENFDKLLNGKYKCKHCGRETVAKISMDEHINACHLQNKYFLCDVCGKDCYSEVSLRKHKIVHVKTREFQCSMCPKTFKQKDDVRKHYYNVHDPSKIYRCSNCKRDFRSKASLERHTQKMHTFWDGEQKAKEIKDDEEITLEREQEEDNIFEATTVETLDKDEGSNIETLIIEDGSESADDENESFEDGDLDINHYYKDVEEGSNDEGGNEEGGITIYEFYG